jgi:hypothetical protein
MDYEYTYICVGDTVFKSAITINSRVCYNELP